MQSELSFTCMYKSSFLRCSAINSTASVALVASGLSNTESELSDPLLSPMPSPPPAPLELLVVWCLRLILQFG